MIIECENCKKKFEVDDNLIPSEGRTIQCGSCDHKWFFKKDLTDKNPINVVKKDFGNPSRMLEDDNSEILINDQPNKIEDLSITDNSKKTYKGFSHILKKTFSYIIIIFITLIGLIILLDTFKNPLYIFVPSLELYLFNFFEVLKDVNLFIRDLI